VPSTDPLTLKEIFLYNLAGFAFNIYDTILYAWVTYFYITATTEHAKYITTILVGIILSGGRILDALTDPFIGYMSDRTKTRWGRRKPYMFVSYPILLISFVLVWTPPVNGTSVYNALYLGVVLFFYYWSYTGVLIPWFAMLPEMSKDNQERVKIASIGVALGVFAALLAGGIGSILYEKTGAFKMALIFGLVGFIVGEIGLFGTKERYRPDLDEETPGFFAAIKTTFQERQVLSFAIMIMLVQLTYQLMLMIVPFLTTITLGLKEGMSAIILGEVIFLMGAVVPLWFYLLSKYPKRNVFRGIIITHRSTGDHLGSDRPGGAQDRKEAGGDLLRHLRDSEEVRMGLLLPHSHRRLHDLRSKRCAVRNRGQGGLVHVCHGLSLGAFGVHSLQAGGHEGGDEKDYGAVGF